MREILEKIDAEGDFEKFEYLGYECEIVRNGSLGHLCGYLKGRFSEKELEIIDDNFHCGITYDSADVVGFDCAHTGDVVPYGPNFEVLGYESYKDMCFVKEVLKTTIDKLKERPE